MSAPKAKKAASKKDSAQTSDTKAHHKSVILPERTTFLLVHNLHQSITNMFEALVDGKTTVNQFEVLRFLLDSGTFKPSPTNVIEHTNIDRTTMSQLLARMINAELVVREDDPLDGRVYRLSVTDKGRQVYNIGLSAMIEIEDKIQNVFGFDVATKWIGTVNKLYPYVSSRSVNSVKAKQGKQTEDKHATTNATAD